MEQRPPRFDSFTLVLMGLIILLFLGTVAFILLSRQGKQVLPYVEPPQQGGGERLIAPVVSAPPKSESLAIGERKELEATLSADESAAMASGTITRSAVYFRDLNDGPVVSMHSHADFSPASLLKLPVAMWFYRQASTSPDYLTQEIQFTGPKGTSIVHFPGKRGMEVGKTYTYEDLLALMLEESDNDATSILGSIVGLHNTALLYRDLGVPPVSNYDTYIINVQDYASFFRVLYNGTYVGRPGSERILEDLANASFIQGLVAGVPSGTTVAHKFGERVIDAKQGVVQVHDCGIVYYPEHPYVLCVMTQGRDYDALAVYIAHVSKTVYAAVDANP